MNDWADEIIYRCGDETSIKAFKRKAAQALHDEREQCCKEILAHATNYDAGSPQDLALRKVLAAIRKEPYDA